MWKPLLTKPSRKTVYGLGEQKFNFLEQLFSFPARCDLETLQWCHPSSAFYNGILSVLSGTWDTKGIGVYPPVPILHYKKVYVQSVKRHDTHVSGWRNGGIFKLVLNIFFLHNISRGDSITENILHGNLLFHQKY